MLRGECPKLVYSMMELEKIVGDKPLSYAHMLAIVMNEPDIPYVDVMKKLGVSKSTTARTMAWFMDNGIMTTYDIPENKRYKAARLTEKGERLVFGLRKLCHDFGEPPERPAV